jgi:hypothetical protein
MSWMILFKKQLFDLVVPRRSLRYAIDRLMVMHPHTKYNWPTFLYLERQKSYSPDKLCWEEAEEKIRLKQYVSLRSKGRHNYMSALYIQVWLYIIKPVIDITCLMWSYFNVPLEGHIQQVWEYMYIFFVLECQKHSIR